MYRTPRDEAILRTLTHRVRMLSLEQIARTWWSDSDASRETARRRLRHLASAGLLERVEILTHPILALDGPLFFWTEGGEPPDSGALSYRLKVRWTESPEATSVYLATRRAANEFGGFGGPIKARYQATHDLHVSEVFLRLTEDHPEVESFWTAEEQLPNRRNDFNPDAEIRDPTGATTLVVEFGGAYEVDRVEHIHASCEGRGVPYQIW